MVSDSSGTEPNESSGSAAQGPDATVTADAQVPGLDEGALASLREVGMRWANCMADREAWDRALPIDPELRYLEDEQSGGDRFVRIRSARPGDEDDLEATPMGTKPIRASDGWNMRRDGY